MEPRLKPTDVSPKAYQALLALNSYVENCGLEKSLLELVKMRASQINGCAYCLHMHSKDAIAHGEDPIRLVLLDAWRESPAFTPRERAALAWTESLTRIAETQAPDEDYRFVSQHFTPDELVNLSVAIAMINTWNRLSIGFRAIHPPLAKAA